jgi:hypothetical protein
MNYLYIVTGSRYMTRLLLNLLKTDLLLTMPRLHARHYTTPTAKYVMDGFSQRQFDGDSIDLNCV